MPTPEKETDHELNPWRENYFYDQFDVTEENEKLEKSENPTEPSRKITYETPKNWSEMRKRDVEAKRERMLRRRQPDFEDPGNFQNVQIVF